MRLALPLQFLVVTLAGWINRAQQDVIEYLKTEREVLLEHFGGKAPRLTDDQRRRLAAKGQVLGRRVLGTVAGVVTPDTIIRWYRRLIAKKYDGARARQRSAVRESVTDMLLRFCRESPTWGYTRLRDALRHAGKDVSRATVVRILKEHGIEPAAERGRATKWREFLEAHWQGLAAADFFTVEVATWRGLVRYFVFFVMELKTRRVEIAGITSRAGDEWMKQIARNLTDRTDGFLQGLTHLILDRDPLYTKGFRVILRGSGLSLVTLPANSPNLNAYAERWVRSIRSELLERIVPLGEGFLRWSIAHYMVHYHQERPHQGLESRIIEPEPKLVGGDGPGRIVRRVRVGRLLNYYYRTSA